MPPSPDRSALRAIALVFAGIVLVGTSFMFASSDFAFSAKSLLATVIESFSSDSTITISRNANSPEGVIRPGGMQALAVFDVKPRFIKQIAYIQQMTIAIKTETQDANANWKLGLSQFVLDYRYCLSKGDVYGYGYSYDDSGLFCRNIAVTPSSVGFEDETYYAVFAQTLPVYPNQVSGELAISANPQYRAPDQSGREITELRAGITDGTSAYTNICTRVEETWNCQTLYPRVNTDLAYGNELKIAPHYGYGYAYLDGISPSDASVGDTINVWGWNLLKSELAGNNLSLGIFFSGGGAAGIIRGNSSSNDNVIQFILESGYPANVYCGPGEACPAVGVYPGEYKIFANTRRGSSNWLTLNVVPDRPAPLTCDDTARVVINSIGGCEAVDPAKYQNVFAACCKITRNSLLKLLDNALADGVVDEHEKSVLLTALNSYLFE